MEENTMLKTISAALLAVSVLAAPALAASTDKPAQATATKSAQVNRTGKSALNANAKMGRHHTRHASHHRSHKKMVTNKTHKSTLAAKHFAHPAKRG
jgi:Ni/Co efflux regulator RcnB